MALIDQARETIGQLLIMGFAGLELPDETSAFISQAKIGGVILFTPNYENPGQLAELTNQIQECRSEFPLWIGVDQEGGRVQRFKKPFTRIPEASAIAALDSPKLAFAIGEMIAKELKAAGVNLNFSPVADIATNPKNTVIGTRAYGATEEMVTKMATAMVRGHLVGGVQPCIKHFPGHGDTATDSHFALPKVETSLEQLLERELKPFTKAFKSKCGMVMTAHIIYTALDPDHPATLSRKILHDLLRTELRYTKLVISDDMEMKAISDHTPAADAPRIALQAGCDMLVYRTEAKARSAYEALVRDLDQGNLAAETVMAAAERVKAAKMEFLMPYHPVVIAEVGQKIGIAEHAALMTKLSEA